MIFLGLLVIHLIYEGHQSGHFVQGWSLLPLLPSLGAIAFTSPDSRLHLFIFAGVAVYGFVWLAVFACLHGRKMIALSTGFLAIMSLVFLALFSFLGMLSPAIKNILLPLGLFQKGLIFLFAMFAMDQRERPED